jgi:hypothetical protein
MDMLSKYFSDCKVLVGINYGSHERVESILGEYKLNCIVKRLENKIFHVNSDTSAFQLCLQLFQNETTKYNVVWFIHTKGAFNDRDIERTTYLTNFFPQRKFIENRFEIFPKIGVYGYRCGGYMWRNHEDNLCKNNTERFIREVWDYPSTQNLPYDFCELIVVETMFAMNAEIVYDFLSNYPEFITTPLSNIPTSRWYIELELCNIIPTRMGYIPLVISDEYIDTRSLKTEIQGWLTQWITKNKLDHLTDYMRLL